MILGRALRLLSSAGCLLGLLALGHSATAQSPTAQVELTQNAAGQNTAAQNATAQNVSSPTTAVQTGSNWSGSDSASLSHALRKSGDSSSAATPAKLFNWAIGDPDMGQALDGGQDLDQNEIETDRPDFTQNRKTVGRGVAQLETGVTYLRGRNNSFIDYSFPETLLRVGVVADWLELRLSQNFSSQRTNDPNGSYQSKTGAQDMVVGVKLALTAQRGWLPEMGMIVHTSVPSGAPGFTSGILLPGLNWLYGWDITTRLSLSGSTQAYKTTDLVPLPTSRGGTGSLDHTQHAFIVVAQSYSLEYEVTDKLTPYFEWFALFPSGAMNATKTPQHYLDSGFTYKVTPNIQLDARAGMGLSRFSTALFAGSGLSIRY